MIEYLRDIVSKSKAGDKYGKFQESLSLHFSNTLLAIF